MVAVLAAVVALLSVAADEAVVAGAAVVVDAAVVAVVCAVVDPQPARATATRATPSSATQASSSAFLPVPIEPPIQLAGSFDAQSPAEVARIPQHHSETLRAYSNAVQEELHNRLVWFHSYLNERLGRLGEAGGGPGTPRQFPSLRAFATASVRLCAASFELMFRKWNFTVCGDRNSRSASTLLGSPAATITRISCSLGVSASGSSGSARL